MSIFQDNSIFDYSYSINESLFLEKIQFYIRTRRYDYNIYRENNLLFKMYVYKKKDFYLIKLHSCKKLIDFDTLTFRTSLQPDSLLKLLLNEGATLTVEREKSMSSVFRITMPISYRFYNIRKTSNQNVFPIKDVFKTDELYIIITEDSEHPGAFIQKNITEIVECKRSNFLILEKENNNYTKAILRIDSTLLESVK